VQKAMVDKLSDKITVVIAPPGTDGKFLGSAITGDLARSTPAAQVAQRNIPAEPAQEDAEGNAEKSAEKAAARKSE
jgi:hypothetical protein